MIERKHRFQGYSSLRFVYKNGQTVRGPLFSLKFVENNRRQTWRLAIVVSRKVSKLAVERNRIRRRIYEIFREQDHNIVKPFDFLIIVFSPNLSKMEPDKLMASVLELLERAGVKTTKVSRKPTNSHDIVSSKED